MRTLLTFASVSFALVLGVVSIARAEHPVAKPYIQGSDADLTKPRLTSAIDKVTGVFSSTLTVTDADLSVASFSAADPAAASRLTADLNHDSVVDINDLLMVLQSWGSCAATTVTAPHDCSADFNGDSNIDIKDLLIILSEWSR